MKKPAVQASQQNLFEIEAVVIPPKQKEKRESDYVFDIMDALRAPILTFTELWADTIPQRLLDIVQIARMKALIAGEKSATDPECVIYIYTRTYEAPMDGEWTDIYTHISCKTLEQWFGEDHWKEVKAPTELSEWLRSKLNRLRRHIYDKRREILKGRLGTEEKKVNEVPKKEPGPIDSSSQQSLFS